jgi:hypothetical protein
MKKIGCFLLLLVLLPVIAWAQTADDFAASQQAMLEQAKALRDAKPVWVSPYSRSYHATENCTPLLEAYQMTRGEAETASRVPCVKCYPQAAKPAPRMTAEPKEALPLFRLTSDDFLARYNAIAAERTGDSAPYLQLWHGDESSYLYSTPSEYVTVFVIMADAANRIDEALVALDPVALTAFQTAMGGGVRQPYKVLQEEVQIFATTCELAILAADPSLGAYEADALFDATIAQGIDNMGGDEKGLMAEKGGIEYFFNPPQTSYEGWYYFHIRQPG